MARREARQSFDAQLAGVERCDLVDDTALHEPLVADPRRVRFAGSTLTVTVTCSPFVQPRLLSIEVTDTEEGVASGPCRVTVLGEGRLQTVAHVVTDDQGRANVVVPDRVVSLLVTRADDVVTQTAWLRF